MSKMSVYAVDPWDADAVPLEDVLAFLEEQGYTAEVVDDGNHNRELRITKRVEGADAIMPLLAAAWDEGREEGWGAAHEYDYAPSNPYREGSPS